MNAEADFRVLAALARDPFASHAAIGRTVGTSAEAVRKRIQRLTQSGVLVGFSALPAAETLGRVAAGIAFDEPVSMQALLELDDALYAASSVDGKRGVMGYTHDAEAFFAAAVTAAGTDPMEQVVQPARGIPPLGPLDWKVARALVHDPRATIRSVAEATGLGPRTVRARRERLVATGALDVQPVLRPSQTGALYYHVWVRFEPDAPGAAESELLTGFAHALVIDRLEDSRSVYLFAASPDLGSQAATLDRLRRRPDVAFVQLVLNDAYVLHTERLDAWIQAALDEWDMGRRS